MQKVRELARAQALPESTARTMLELIGHETLFASLVMHWRSFTPTPAS